MKESQMYLEKAVKEYKKEVQALEDAKNEGLITPLAMQKKKLEIKKKYKELIAKEGKVSGSSGFERKKSLFEITEMFVDIWKECGRKSALRQLDDFYIATPRDKDKALVWKTVVQKMKRE